MTREGALPMTRNGWPEVRCVGGCGNVAMLVYFIPGRMWIKPDGWWPLYKKEDGTPIEIYACSWDCAHKAITEKSEWEDPPSPDPAKETPAP